MMADYIDRKATIDAVTGWLNIARNPINQSKYNDGEIAAYETALSELKKIPSADVQPVRHGHWYHGEAYPHHLYCSVCYRTALPNDEYVERWGLHMNYCPNCGARMDGKQDG